MTNQDQSREAFETWARSQPENVNLTREGSGYRHVYAECFWEAWQAARSAPAVELPEPGATVFATQGIQEALASLIREAQDVADDCHRPRYTRLDQVLESARTALAAASNLSSGWVAVPVEPTEEMHVAACKVLQRANGLDGTPKRMLDAMLAAAPKLESVDKTPDLQEPQVDKTTNLQEPKLPQGDCWLPIESAPKDGSEILLVSRKCRIANGCWMTANDKVGAWMWPYVLQEPTHWMPLPQPPQEEG